MVKAATIRRALKLDYLSQPALVWEAWSLLAIGSMFWAMATFRDAAFSEGVYGELALRFPAEMWAALMMGPAAMILIGLQDPIRHWMVGCGAVVQLLQFCVLGYSAIFTGGEPIIGVFCYVYFAPRYLRMAWEAGIDPRSCH